MTVKWEPDWYELDQSIVVGDMDFFYLAEDKLSFAHGLSWENYACEIKAEILKITHPELGEVKGIIAIGLDYSIYLSDGNVIIVNAEENPGETYDSQYAVSGWAFNVEINMIEETGRTAIERNREERKRFSQKELKAQRQECIRKYKILLGLSQADWEC